MEQLAARGAPRLPRAAGPVAHSLVSDRLWVRRALQTSWSSTGRLLRIDPPAALGEIQLLTGVLAEVGLQERGRFWHGDADVGQILHLHAQVCSLAVQDVPAAAV